MKKLLLLLVCIPGFAIAQVKIETNLLNGSGSSSVFTPKANEVNNSTAQVEQINGLFVFSYCKPFKKYKVIGEVKNGRMTNGEHQLVGSYLTEKAKKTYPTAQAIIIKFQYGIGSKGIYAEVIEFIE